jgi:hypothetical protein
MLVAHDVEVTYNPVLRLTVRGLVVGSLALHVRVSLRVSGSTLTLRAGEIVEAQVSSVGAHGTIKFDGVTIAAVDTDQVPRLGNRLVSVETHRAGEPS